MQKQTYSHHKRAEFHPQAESKEEEKREQLKSTLNAEDCCSNRKEKREVSSSFFALFFFKSVAVRCCVHMYVSVCACVYVMMVAIHLHQVFVLQNLTWKQARKQMRCGVVWA